MSFIFAYGTELGRASQFMRPTGVARWESNPSAAGGRRSEGAELCSGRKANCVCSESSGTANGFPQER